MRKKEEKADWEIEDEKFKRRVEAGMQLIRFLFPLMYFVLAGVLITNALTNFPESIDPGRLGSAVTCFGVGILFMQFEKK